MTNDLFWPYELHELTFATTNEVKAAMAREFGFNVREHELDVPEIHHINEVRVALHKCRDLNEPGLMVEDTALQIEDAPFYGTEIKHRWEEVEADPSYHRRKAVWGCALAFLAPDGKHFVVVHAETEGILLYPGSTEGYHFERIFALQVEGVYRHFGTLTSEQRRTLSPRYKALQRLSNKFKGDPLFRGSDFNIVSYRADGVKQWKGAYQ